MVPSAWSNLISENTHGVFCLGQLSGLESRQQMLKAKASNEIEWINKVAAHANGNFAVIKWSSEEIKGDKLLEL